jgi:hypothetical protein
MRLDAVAAELKVKLSACPGGMTVGAITSGVPMLIVKPTGTDVLFCTQYACPLTACSPVMLLGEVNVPALGAPVTHAQYAGSDALCIAIANPIYVVEADDNAVYVSPAACICAGLVADPTDRIWITCTDIVI